MKATINRIRLINFHNFVNETIEVRDGGHLFMLGDNGSGKTTVLDAVHYVLTAGRSMEFNAAARVIGRERSGGRSVQGVVMRYNIESGAGNPNGGTTYAALEIAGRGGRPTCLAIGMATRSMEEAIERWGVIRECSLEELPLLITDGHGCRPASRNELRDSLGGSGFHAQIGAYEKELARRFFGDSSTYEDFCKLLKTAKAYREIVAGTADYHALFRELLQEPEREVFEDVVTHLKSLEESRSDLEALRRKLAFVQELAGRRDEVAGRRSREAACRWMAWDLALKGYWSGHDQAAGKAAAEEHRRSALDEEGQRIALQLEGLQQRLTELLNKDSQNLVGQEQLARREVERSRFELGRSQARLKELTAALEQAQTGLAQARADLRKQLAGLGRQIQKLAAAVPFQTSSLRLALEEAAASDTPESAVAGVPAMPLRHEADLCLRALDRQVQETSSQMTALGRRRDRAAAAIAELRGRGDVMPALPAFGEAQASLRQQALDAQPLYLGLEPVAGATSRELTALEQLIGEEVLATWLVSDGDAMAARGVILRDFPGLSLAVKPQRLPDDPGLSEWLRRYFDVAKSDPAALLVLQQHVESRHGPSVGKFLDHAVLTFRLREQRLSEEPPRLIGAETRRRELERRIRGLEKEQREAERELREAEKALAGLQQQVAQVESFRRLLDDGMMTALTRKDGIQERLQAATGLARDCENGRAECGSREEEYQRHTARHEDLRIRLQSEGLAGLEQRIHEVRQQERKLKQHHEDVIHEKGRISQAIETHKAAAARCQEHIRATIPLLAEAEAQLRRLAATGDAFAAFAAAETTGIEPTPDALQDAAGAAGREAAVAAEKIRHLAASADGVAFAFVYDEAANSLTDRRGRSLGDVLAGTTAELQEQETVITEKTVELFRRIVMHGLVNALQFRVRRLNDMIRRIGRLLKERSFGSNRYAFSAVPQDAFRKIHDLVLDYSGLDPEHAEAELRHFIEDHRQEIMNTEVGEIPAILDYRNWFRYELRVLTPQEGGIVMDRRIKSIGSGGEQAVPNYLLILTIASFLLGDEKVRLPVLLFDEAFYGIDAGRRDQLLAFASDLELQLFVASPDQDGVKKEIPCSTSVLVVKDAQLNVHLYDFHWTNRPREQDFMEAATLQEPKLGFSAVAAGAMRGNPELAGNPADT